MSLTWDFCSPLLPNVALLSDLDCAVTCLRTHLSDTSGIDLIKCCQLICYHLFTEKGQIQILSLWLISSSGFFICKCKWLYTISIHTLLDFFSTSSDYLTRNAICHPLFPLYRAKSKFVTNSNHWYSCLFSCFLVKC